METQANQIRRAAADTAGALNSDLFDLIGEGCENAANTMGDRADDNAAEFSDLAISSIACALCERDFTPRYGSDAQAVRDWFFAAGVSY